jgi:hypothetical protein
MDKQNILKGLKTFGLELNRRWYSSRFSETPDEFVSGQWDNLIILDAARPEITKEYNPFDKCEVEERISPGSFSLQFIEEQFLGREMHDTIYITANPHVHDIQDRVFYKVLNLLKTEWNPEHKTVMPNDVVKEAVRVYEEFPDKRIIIHFMQPHYPFLGETGDKITSGIPKSDISDDSYHHPWFDQMWHGTYDREVLLTAYRENHEIALEHAAKLVNVLNGRTVITSDHANLIGERGGLVPMRLYGHPRYFYHPDLVTVPWIDLGGDTRTVSAERPVSTEQMEETEVNRRLTALGYK